MGGFFLHKYHIEKEEKHAILKTSSLRLSTMKLNISDSWGPYYFYLFIYLWLVL